MHRYMTHTVQFTNKTHFTLSIVPQPPAAVFFPLCNIFTAPTVVIITVRITSS
jgi:hypothetical protein